MNDDNYVGFAGHVNYRGLECPYIFDKLHDELYELDEEGLEFANEVDGTRRAGEIENRELLEYSRSEGLLEFFSEPTKRPLSRGQSPIPSLRYLEMMVTLRCNLKCSHCYLGDGRAEDMEVELMRRVISEFDQMQGLRLLISGGEPLMYPHLEELGREIEDRGFRSVLLTNGTMLDSSHLETLPLQEVQVSIDGLEEGHDRLRGKGTFQKALAAARLVADRGLDLSVATMIHSGNLGELEKMEELVKNLGAREWSLEAPSGLGRWSDPGDMEVPFERAGALIGLGYGGSYHGSSEGYACGLHLAAVMSGGDVVPCGFYEDRPLGNAGDDGLEKAWKKKRVKRLDELEWCGDCDAAADCGGGCRFRAGGDGPDPLMCAAHGNPRGEPLKKGS